MCFDHIHLPLNTPRFTHHLPALSNFVSLSFWVTHRLKFVLLIGINCQLLFKGWASRAPPPSMIEYQLSWSCAGNYGCCEFLSTAVLSCLEHPPRPPGAVIVFLPSFLWWSLNLGTWTIHRYLFPSYWRVMSSCCNNFWLMLAWHPTVIAVLSVHNWCGGTSLWSKYSAGRGRRIGRSRASSATQWLWGRSQLQESLSWK